MSKLILAAAFSISFASTSSMPGDDQRQVTRALARHFQPNARLEFELVDPTDGRVHLALSPEMLHIRPARAAIPTVLDR